MLIRTCARLRIVSTKKFTDTPKKNCVRECIHECTLICICERLRGLKIGLERLPGRGGGDTRETYDVSYSLFTGLARARTFGVKSLETQFLSRRSG